MHINSHSWVYFIYLFLTYNNFLFRNDEDLFMNTDGTLLMFSANMSNPIDQNWEKTLFGMCILN